MWMLLQTLECLQAKTYPLSSRSGMSVLYDRIPWMSGPHPTLKF